MIVLIAGCVLAGFLVSTLATALMRRLAPRIGLVDHPNARKVHVTPTPLGGGIGIWCGIVFPLLVGQGVLWWLSATGPWPIWLPTELEQYVRGLQDRSAQTWQVLLGGTLLSVLGLVDDLRNLRWQPKILVQFAVAGTLVFVSGVKGTLFFTAPWVGQLLTVLWIVVLTNAFNFLDNMDGLSSGIALITSVIFAVIMLTGTSHPHWFVAALLLTLAGSVAGFLVHNWPPAKIFMGDTGSCLIGMLLACSTVLGTFYEYERTSKHVILVPLCVLAVPLYDFTSVVLIRLSQGRSPFHADKQHFSHRLVEMGMSKLQAVLTIHLVTLTTGLGGLLMYQVASWSGAILVICLELCILAVIAILETAGRSSKG